MPTLPLRGQALGTTGLWGGVYLARAAQQRQQLGAQRQACNEHAGKSKKQCGKNECRSHGSDYKDIFRRVQQILLNDQPPPEFCFRVPRQFHAAIT